MYLLTEVHLGPPKSTLAMALWSLVDTRHEVEMLSCLICALSAEVEPGNALPSFSALILETNVFLAVYLVSHFSLFFFFFSVYNDPPSIALKCSLVFLSARRLQCAVKIKLEARLENPPSRQNHLSHVSTTKTSLFHENECNIGYFL